MPEILDANVQVTSKSMDSGPGSLKNRIRPKDMGSRLSRETPQLQRRSQTYGRDDSQHDIFSFVYSFLNDTPEETLDYIAESLVSVMNDETLSQEQRKVEVDDLLGHELSGKEFDGLRSISLRVSSAQNGGDPDSMSDDEGLDEFDEESDGGSADENGNSPMFISLNDPMRIRDKTLVQPQEIDSHWLKVKLDSTGIGVEAMIELLKSVEELPYSERLENLEQHLGLEHFSLAKLLAKSTSVVLWYTLLALAQTGIEREQVMETIHAKNLSIEQVASTMMDQDLPKRVDLNLVGRPVSVPIHLNVKLPNGSTKFTTHDYEQYNIPSNDRSNLDVDWNLKMVTDLPEYVQPCFEGIPSLNTVQSKVCDTVIDDDINILLCAPTGAGKTNVALLALARCIHAHHCRAVYIAPLKALVQEQVATLQARFKHSNISVAELSGDLALGREQIRTVDIIVATPEKWDIITRKMSNIELLRSIGLVVVDEIHLLHDERRGGVIENIVARHKLQKLPPRLVGLSATLPNFADVASFLDVPPPGIFFFDFRFRPVPLEQHFIGISAPSPVKVAKITNEVCAEKVSEIVINAKKQVLVFVHSRKDTEDTREFIAEKTELQSSEIGIHHAGLDRDERADSERNFKLGKFRVLVCTATLAWGVNLPAAAVIIKGTQYYDPSSEGWRQLSPQDVLQMFGRAGRPGFDTQGLGLIITSQKYLGYFASVATLSLPIQSYLISRICDSLNAEISNYSIKSIDEASAWLKQTFWYIRSQEDPAMYGNDYTCLDIVHSALLKLDKIGACIYDYPYVRPTFVGELAADFYIAPDSAATYLRQLKPWLADLDLIRVFARAAEFSTFSVRRGELGEIARLAPLVPFPIRDSLDSRFAKVSILLQAYVSRLSLTGLALRTDMAYIAQSASRLFRSFFEAALALKWSKLARSAHTFFLMVDKRQWITAQTPLRQFEDCPLELIQRAEACQLPWPRYFDLDENDIGEILRLGSRQLASAAVKYLSRFPRFSLQGKCQPLNSDWLLATIEIEALFEFDEAYHQSFEQFWLLIEDQNSNLLYSKCLTMQDLLSKGELNNRCSIHTAYLQQRASKTSGKYPPYLFAWILSDRWLNADYETPIMLRKLTPPQSTTTLFTLSDDDSLHTDQSVEAQEMDFKNSYTHLTQRLLPLLRNSPFVYIGLPPSLEAQECINVIITQSNYTKLLILSPKYDRHGCKPSSSDLIHYMGVAEAERLSKLRPRFLREFTPYDVVLCSDMHTVGSKYGDIYEQLVTRLKSLSSIRRIIGIGYPIGSVRSITQWLGGSKSDAVNFGFDVLEHSPEIEFRSHKGTRSVTMALQCVIEAAKKGSLLILTRTKRQRLLFIEELQLQGLLSPKEGDSSNIRIEICSGNGSILSACQFEPRSVDRVLLFDSGDLDSSGVLDVIGVATQYAVVFTEQPDFFRACIDNVNPLESQLHSTLASAMVPEICANGSWSPQDAVDWLTTTFLYRRLRANPGYYGSQDLQDWVSETVESTFDYLSSIGAVSMDEESLEVEPLAMSHILCHYGVSLQDLIEEDDTHIGDQHISIKDKLQVLDARISLAAATNQLAKLFKAIDVRQAVARDVPLYSSPLLQIPRFNDEIVLRCQDAGIQSVQEFIGIEDDDLRSQLLGFDNEDPRMVEVADFVNHFPIVDITAVQLEGNTMTVYIERELEQDEETLDDGWYLVVGNRDTNDVYGFKYMHSINKPELAVSIDLNDHTESTNYKTWLMCGTYIDADKEYADEYADEYTRE